MTGQKGDTAPVSSIPGHSPVAMAAPEELISKFRFSRYHDLDMKETPSPGQRQAIMMKKLTSLVVTPP